MLRIAVDAGGTFTDAVCSDGRVAKVPSCPAAPERAVAAAVAALHPAGPVSVIHGTTVGTNALLTQNLPATGVITQRGFEHLLLIGRQARPGLYALAPRQAWLPLNRDLCRGVPGRIDAHGRVLEGFDARACRQAGRSLVAAGAQALAVVFLHAWRDPAHEQAALKALSDLGVPLTISSDLQREFREVERGTAALLNAALRPVLGPYLDRLSGALPGHTQLSVMTSAGGTVAPHIAAQQPVRLLLSGPAGGVLACADLARRHRLGPVLSLDMGGTSADVAWCDGSVPHCAESVIAGVTVRVPTLAIHTVGAGGGSIARVDAGGVLAAGPASAGADPGPACFGRGGPFTVTDAHLVLGSLAPQFFPEGAAQPERGPAERALRSLARKLGLTPLRTARGVLELADSGMVRALRRIGAEQGRDPRHCTLLPFGGAGGLHALSLARALGMKRVLLPAAAGALSARGLLLAPQVCTRSRSILQPLDSAARGLQRVVRALRDEALAELGLRSARGCEVHVGFDLRYAGQSFEFTVPQCADLAGAFHRVHQRQAGFADAAWSIECVTVHVRVEIPAPVMRAQRLPAARGRKARSVGVSRGLAGALPLWDRDLLLHGQRISGPGLICDRTGSALLHAGDEACVLHDGSILVQVGGAA